MKFDIPAVAFNEIMEWAKVSSEAGYSFGHTKSRATVLRKLESTGIVPEHCKPQSTSIQVGRIPAVTVRRFPFLENIKYLFGKESLMKDSIWRYNGESEFYGELNTGKWWKRADEALATKLRNNKIPNPERHYVCPILLFDDATHCDKKGIRNTVIGGYESILETDRVLRDTTDESLQ